MVNFFLFFPSNLHETPLSFNSGELSTLEQRDFRKVCLTYNNEKFLITEV